jgi:hypothetical protein
VATSITGRDFWEVLNINLRCYEHNFMVACELMNDHFTEVTPLYKEVSAPRMRQNSIKEIMLLDFSDMSEKAIVQCLRAQHFCAKLFFLLSSCDVY